MLNDGHAVLEGEAHRTSTLEIKTPADHTFESVAEAMRQFRGVPTCAVHSASDVVIAVAGDAEELSFPRAAEQVIDEMGRPAIAIHLALLERPSALLAPPHTWPLKQAMRRALIESEIVLVHVVDLDGFVGPASNGASELTEVRTVGEEVRGFVVVTNDIPSHVSPRLLNDVLYGFQTVQSARDQIVDGVTSSFAELGAPVPPPGTSYARVDSRAELDTLLARIEAGEPPPEYVTLAPEMVDRLTDRDRELLMPDPSQDIDEASI